MNTKSQKFIQIQDSGELLTYLLKNSTLIRSKQKELSAEKFNDIFYSLVRDTSILENKIISDEQLSGFLADMEAAFSNPLNQILSIQSSPPVSTQYTMGVIADALKNLELNQEKTFVLGRKTSGTKKIIKATLTTTDENIRFLGKSNITSYDKLVHDAVCTLLNEGTFLFTDDMVYRCMNGLTNSEFVCAANRAQVKACIQKLMNTEISIDYSKQAKGTTLDGKEIEQLKIQSRMLSFDRVIVKTGGQVKDGYLYRQKDMPPVYTYSKAFKQIISVPNVLLNTNHIIKGTDNLTVVRAFLIQQIEAKKKTLDDFDIKFKDIYKEVGLDSDSGYFRQYAANIRKSVCKLLDYYASPEIEYIVGYELVKSGRAVAAIRIHT